MNTNLSGLCLLSLTFLLASCMLNLEKKNDSGKPELVPISINNDYSLSVPSYMTKTKVLNEEASLQFQNRFKETYVIVIDEDKQTFADVYVELGYYDSTRSVLMNYADTQIQSALADLDNISTSDVTELTINGLPAVQTQIDGVHDQVNRPISYFLTFVEGDQRLYMIMGWTLKTNKASYENTFREVSQSFRLLHVPVTMN